MRVWTKACRGLAAVLVLALVGTALAAGAQTLEDAFRAQEEALAEASSPEGEAAPVPVEPTESAVAIAWRMPADDLATRVDETRRAALEVGAWNLDPAARALIRGSREATPLERAQAAVRLAPDLPASHLALAEALWLLEEEPMSALHSVVAGVGAIGRHPEASLWFAGSGLAMGAVALIAAALLLMLIAAATNARHAAHDLSHLLPGRGPAFAGFALLAALLLLPVWLGEGILGVALVLLFVGMLYGSNARRIALAVSAVGLYAGLHVLPGLAGATLTAFPHDPVARAAYSTAQGQASPVDVARLEHAAAEDALALRGLAIHARQTGNLGRADALYQRLLADHPDDIALINNAANVRLDLGHVDSALELYDRALTLSDSAIVLFNVSQAYGRSFQVDDLNRTLAEAQRADGELVARFTALQRTRNEGFVVDFPLTARQAWDRALAEPRGAALAEALRRPFAPGRIGSMPDQAGGLIALVVGLAWLATLRFEPSGSCRRCGRRQCERCGDAGSAELCEGCNLLFYEPEKTDRQMRAQRVEALRARGRRMARLRAIGSVLLPGAAGLFAQRPLRGWFGAFCFAFGAAAVLGRGGIVPDPLVAGPAASVVFLGTAGVCAFLYLATVATSLRAAREL